MSRHIAREIALQMLFQIDVGKNEMEVAKMTLAESSLNQEDAAFTLALVEGVLNRLPELDERIAAFCRQWDVARLATVDRSILRLAAFELCYTPEVPGNIVINEAVELAKAFSGDESPAFVNGILDSIYKQEKEHVIGN